VKDETAITAACIEAINATGLAYVWRQGSGVVAARRGYCHLGPIGIPDIVGFMRSGRFIAIETKTPAGAPQPKKRGGGLTKGAHPERLAKQLEWRQRIQAWGGAAAQCRSVAEAIDFVHRTAGVPF
jgi:hypothetical protein